MKIAILTRNSSLYSTQRLIEAGKARGHEVEAIDTLRCYMNITPDAPSIHYNGKPLSDYHAVVPRIGSSITFYGTAVVRQFEMMGIFTLNSSMAITRSRDKLRALQLLSRKGVGIPITGFAHSESDVNDLIEMVGGTPLIIKLLEGTQGKGVILAERQKVAESIIEAFLSLKTNIMVQEYIKEAKGADIRCFVIGNKVVAAIKRQAIAGEFRSNIHRGGKAMPVKITKAEREAAIQATKIMGLKVAGVDILRSARGPLIMEVNSSPGLEGIENATGQDIATLFFSYIEQHAKPISKHSRHQA